METDLVYALADLLGYVEKNECHHEDTDRAGSIWTICRSCRRKWADDENPFTPYVEPPAIANAWKALKEAVIKNLSPDKPKLVEPSAPKLAPGVLLSRMLVFATNAHAGQFDKGGKPYILHPLKVMHYLKSDDEELQCMAVGHDLIEDIKVTYKDLADLGMTDRIINGIHALTRQRGQTEEEYQRQVLANPDASAVKMADIRHNSDIRRLKGVTEKDIARMIRYHEFYLKLEAAEKGIP